MTSTQFRARLEALGWTQRGLAERMGVAHNTVHRWALDQARVPDDVAQWLNDLAQYLQLHPPPR